MRGRVLLGVIMFAVGCYVVDPGERGVKVTLGDMSSNLLQPGFGLLNPFTTSVWRLSVQQQTAEVEAQCFSSDLQQINVTLKILYKVPEGSVISILRDYQGDAFKNLIAPRVQEAIKEVTALKTAADIVKERESIKVASLAGSRTKVGVILTLDDLVIENVALSPELEHAIEAKMVQQQEAEKATFKKQQAETDALTQIIKAKADAESIRIQGEALEKAPKLVELKMVEKWNGVAPQVVGAGSNIMLPIKPPAGRD